MREASDQLIYFFKHITSVEQSQQQTMPFYNFTKWGKETVLAPKQFSEYMSYNSEK